MLTNGHTAAIEALIGHFSLERKQ